MNTQLRIKPIFTALLALLLVACGVSSNQVELQPAESLDSLGERSIKLPVSCSSAGQLEFATALALLHHMMYQQAESRFSALTQQEPTCAMAWWGVAMTQFQPLWPGRPGFEALQNGSTALQKAANQTSNSALEAAFIEAATAFFDSVDSKTHGQRIQAWSVAQQRLYQQYPDQNEAAVFYALAQLATAKKNDPSFSGQQQAGALLEQQYLSNPQHPGVLHYTIHAYDNRLLAIKGVTAADAYDRLAPSVPHALHMPTHIYVRLGQWPKVIDLNARSAQAALKFPVKGLVSHHNPHALDYQMYAYLQQGKDREAGQLLAQLADHSRYQPSFVSAYALAAMSARYLLERRQWRQAAAMVVPESTAFPWAKFPQTLAIYRYTQGLGAVRSGDLASTGVVLSQLDQLYRETEHLYDRLLSIGQTNLYPNNRIFFKYVMLFLLP